MPILHQRLAHVAQPSFFARSFAQQPRIGIGRTLMGGVRALLAVEVDPAIARTSAVRARRRRWLILGSKALETGGGLDQRTVYAEVLIAQQMQSLGLEHDRVEELAADAVAEHPRAVLRKGAVVEAGLEQIHIEKPAEQQVVGQFLAEGAFTAYRVQTAPAGPRRQSA